jgi:hypothetical protein
MKKKITGYLVLGALLLVYRCANEAPNKLQISGTINNTVGANIDSSTRVLVGWSVSGSPNYTYIYGEGSIDLAAKTFSVNFTENPPAEALNSRGVGIGLIFFTNDAQVPARGKIRGELPAVAGATAHAVIFIDQNHGDLAAFRDAWPTRFPVGYSMGEGYDIPGGSIDGFKPTGNTGIPVQTDFVTHRWVNWT